MTKHFLGEKAKKKMSYTYRGPIRVGIQQPIVDTGSFAIGRVGAFGTSYRATATRIPVKISYGPPGFYSPVRPGGSGGNYVGGN